MSISSQSSGQRAFAQKLPRYVIEPLFSLFLTYLRFPVPQTTCHRSSSSHFICRVCLQPDEWGTTPDLLQCEQHQYMQCDLLPVERGHRNSWLWGCHERTRHCKWPRPFKNSPQFPFGWPTDLPPAPSMENSVACHTAWTTVSSLLNRHKNKHWIYVWIYRESLNSHVRDCVRCYTAPWLIVQHRYQEYSTGTLARPSSARLNTLTAAPRQEFEVDIEVDANANSEDDTSLPEPSPKVAKQYIFPISTFIHPISLQASSIRGSISEHTPRGSWATFDLRQTASDPLLPGLLDRLAPDAIDSVNRLRRLELQLVKISKYILSNKVISCFYGTGHPFFTLSTPRGRRHDWTTIPARNASRTSRPSHSCQVHPTSVSQHFISS